MVPSDLCVDTLTALATFTQLEELSLHCGWFTPQNSEHTSQMQALQVQHAATALLTALGSLRRLVLDGGLQDVATLALTEALPSMTALCSFRVQWAMSGSSFLKMPAEQISNLLEGMAQLPALRSLELDYLRVFDLQEDYAWGHRDHRDCLPDFRKFCSTLANLTALTSLTLNQFVWVMVSGLDEDLYHQVIALLGQALTPLTLLES